MPKIKTKTELNSNPLRRYSAISLIRLPALLLTIILLFVISPYTYADSNKLEGQLRISGNIEGDDDRVLDMEFLRSLEQTSITTSTPWKAGKPTFTGVRVSTLLESIGAKSSNFEALAINDYRFTLRDIDFDKYPVIITYEIDGEPLTVKSLGPLWIMFPFDDYPELDTQSNKGASVWQLIEIKVL